MAVRWDPRRSRPQDDAGRRVRLPQRAVPMIEKLLADIRRFGTDTKAVTAVEFALILPLILIMLLETFDITRLVDVKNKTTLLSRTISDFIAQSQTISSTELGNIVAASKSVLYPYPDGATVLTVQIKSINKLANGSFQIDWSYPPASGTNQSTTLTPPDVSNIRTDVFYTYNLKFSGFLVNRLGFTSVRLESAT